MLFLTVNPIPSACKFEDSCSGPHPYITSRHIPVAVACIKHDGIMKDTEYVPVPSDQEFIVASWAGRNCDPSCPEIPVDIPRADPSSVRQIVTIYEVNVEGDITEVRTEEHGELHEG